LIYIKYAGQNGELRVQISLVSSNDYYLYTFEFSVSLNFFLTLYAVYLGTNLSAQQIHVSLQKKYYGVASVSSIDKIIGLFCKQAL